MYHTPSTPAREFFEDWGKPAFALRAPARHAAYSQRNEAVNALAG